MIPHEEALHVRHTKSTTVVEVLQLRLELVLSLENPGLELWQQEFHLNLVQGNSEDLLAYYGTVKKEKLFKYNKKDDDKRWQEIYCKNEWKMNTR